MPHHLRREDWCKYREGVTIESSDKPKKGGATHAKSTHALSEGDTQVDTGLRQRVIIPATIPTKSRVTVKFDEPNPVPATGANDLVATAVAPSAPREEVGFYWGYSTRSASSLSNILTECPFDGGYDLTIGTSERGVPLPDINLKKKTVPKFRHLLIVFGGVAGLEIAVSADKELDRMGVHKPESLFDHWVNLCPGQGSRTIRTEEAVWIGLMGLRDLVLKRRKR